jgi:hypothetical protein
MNKKIIIAAIAGMFTLSLAGCEQRLETEKKAADESGTSTTMPAVTPAPATPDTTAPVVPVTPVMPTTTPATGETTPAEPAKQ